MPAPRPLALAIALAPALLAACGPAAPPPVPPAPPVPPPPAPTASAVAAAPPPVADVDPVQGAMTVEGVKKLCDEHLAKATAILAEIRALKGAPATAITWESTLGRLDDARLEVETASGLPYLMGVAHPDDAVRAAAKAGEPKADKLTTAMWLDADLAAVVKAFAAKSEQGPKADRLQGERARMLLDTLRDFHRNGLDLPPEKQKKLRDMNEELTQIGQDFMSNIGASVGKIEVKPAQLEGLPKEWVAKHAPNAKGAVEVTTDYPDFFPFVTYAKDRGAALDLYVKFTNRGGEANVKLLDRLLKLRRDKAKLLGYETWADYAIEPRMAKSPKNVRTFLAQVKDALREPAKAEMAELVKEHVAAGGKANDKLAPSERYFLEDRVRAAKYKFDSKELSAYLEIGAVKKGLMDLTAKMYGLEYREVPAKAWHPDVTAFEVLSKGELVGKFYFDLYARPNKYKHAAMFTVRTGKRMPGGSYQKPIAALECNFPKPGSEPALMSHEDVVTFFHEFGHVLHHLLTQAELATYSGTSTARDFVEAPSQMFEEWAWSREVLDLFARHHKTGEKIPDDLFAAMTRARGFGRALATQRQLFLATLDLEYHTRDLPFDTTKVVEEVQNATDSFAWVRGTHFQSSFGHLIGYDAGYYGYQWALSLSRDVLTRFKKAGLLDTATAAAWRKEVLSRGGGDDERTMIARFLGREPSHDAYIAFLTGKE